MKSLVVVISIHHDNTVKIANVFSDVLKAPVKKPKDVVAKEVLDYDIVGFGSGIYGAKHHRSLLDLADKLPNVSDKKAFIFSTAGISSKNKALNDHKDLREKLKSKGFVILDDFQCKGFNTNSFLKYLGGMNKGRPNADDLKNAEDFAKNLISNF